jgi:exoribonuclease R
MNNAQKILEGVFGASQFQEKPSDELQGILQTKDYSDFIILDDIGNKIHQFSGAKLANKSLPGDHITWIEEKCRIDLRDEYPPIVGTIELSNKSKFGITSRGIFMYLFTPYDKRYPQFVVGCSEKDTTKNKIGIVKFEKWDSSSTFPRGILQQILGTSGDFSAEKQALIWQACPWKYPKGQYPAELKDRVPRRELKGFTFNIDPAGCKDVDDVLTFEDLGGGQWRITITISDVSAFVEDGSVVDIYASLIGQTLYDIDGKVLRQMLPSEYSEQACSLTPNKDSYGISLQFIWNGKTITNKEWFESTFKTDVSYTYEEFQNSDSIYKTPLQTLSSHLANCHITDSHKWIEQCMLFYNTEAGALLKRNKMGILRKHSQPDIEKLEQYRHHIPEIEKLAYKSAEYCLAEESATTHYGLNTDTYTHISSPIRRYADLLSQRALKSILRNNSEKYIIPIAMYDMNIRAKLNKNFSRDLDFLTAITTGNTQFDGIILESIPCNNNEIKVKLYIPLWKRTISTKYTYIGDNKVLSRDERREINIDNFRWVKIHCTFNANSRNWKDRVIINIL